MSGKRVTHQILADSLILLLVVTILFGLTACGGQSKSSDGQSGGGRKAPAPTVDPWAIAVSAAGATLSRAPDFENRLRNLKNTAMQISSDISAVEQAKPALDMLDNLRNTNILTYGNAYDALIEALNVAEPGSGDALQALDTALNSLLVIKRDLDNLHSLSSVANASAAFRSNPSADNLLVLDQYIKNDQPVLEGLNQELAEAISTLNDISGSISLLNSALNELGAIALVPVVNSVVGSISSAISSLTAPLNSLLALTQSLSNEISSDLTVMNSIVSAVATAQSISPRSVAEIPNPPAENNPPAQATDTLPAPVNPTVVIYPTRTPTLVYQEPPTDTPVIEVPPTETPTVEEPPTKTPTEANVISPAVAVKHYWDTVSAGDYRSAWDLLSPGFQERIHHNDYNDYKNGYLKMQVCSIKTSNLDIRNQDASSAIVFTHLTYKTGSSCKTSEYDFLVYMIYDMDRDMWLLDRVTKP